MAAKLRRAASSSLNRKTPLGGGWGRKVLVGLLLTTVLAVVGITLTSWILHWTLREHVSQTLRTQLEQQLNARVAFGNVGLSLWSHFPNLSLNIQDVSIVGIGEFQRDTLLQAPDADLVMSLSAAWSDATPSPHALYVEGAKLRLKVLRNGSQNWDVLKADGNQQAALNGLETIVAKGSTFSYEDRRRELNFSLDGLEAELQAPLGQTAFDAELELTAPQLNLTQGGWHYLRNARLVAEIDLRADRSNRELRITSSNVVLNALPLRLAGRVTFPADGAFADLSLQSDSDDFRGLLSLLPGVYTDQFDDLKVEGTATSTFTLRGSLAHSRSPALMADVRINDGFFQFPNRPQPVSNVQLSLHLERPADAPDQLAVNLAYLKANLGPNPLEARLVLSGKEQSHLEAQLTAKLKLETLPAIFPFEQHDIKGILDVQLTAAGDFGDSTLPVVSARADLRYGFLKSADFPSPLQNLTLSAGMENKTGRPQDFRLRVSNLYAEIDGEPLEGKLDLQDLRNPNYNLSLLGKLDLGKLARILNLQGAKLRGVVEAYIHTKGQIGNADNKPEASGDLRVTDLFWQGGNLPGLLQIASMQLKMKPNAFEISNCKAQYASTDLDIQGELRNPFGYWFQNDTLRGEIQLLSQSLNLNEWLADATPAVFKAGSGALEVLDAPDRMDVLVATACNNVFYEDLILQNLRGGVLFKHQTLRFVEVSYQMLGAPFSLKGEYDSRDMAAPRFRFQLSVQDLALATAYQHMALMRSYAPVAQHLKGTFSGEALVEGTLDGALNPRPETLSGTLTADISGLATTQPIPLLDALSDKLKIPELAAIPPADLTLEMSFTEGRLYVKPFALSFGDVYLLVSGSISASLDMEYNLMVNVPSGDPSSPRAQAIAAWVGKPVEVAQRIDLPVSIRGLYGQPELSLSETPLLLQTGENAPAPKEEKPKESILETLPKLEAEKKAQEQAEKLKQELEKKALEEQQRIQEELEKQKKEQEQKLKQQKKQTGKPLE